MKTIGKIIGFVGIVAGIFPELFQREQAIYLLVLGTFLYVTTDINS